MSLHPLDVFPETIWTRIFENVKRPWPSIWRGGHNCCFQPVLARLMAVHPALHELVGPVLYRECVVVDLEMFFVGLDGQTQRPEDSERFWTEACQQLICERVSTIPPAPVPTPAEDRAGDHDPSPRKPKRSSKRDLLSHVKVLHLATASPKKSFTGYSRFYGLEKAHVFNYLATRRGLEMFHRASSGGSASTNNPLVRLRKITLDFYHEPDYEYVAAPRHRDTPFKLILGHARNDLSDAFDRFLTVVRPKWVCQHRASDFFCGWKPARYLPGKLQQVRNDPPTILVCHDCRTGSRIPTGYEGRQYVPVPIEDRVQITSWFSAIEIGHYYHRQVPPGTSSKDWPTLEFVLEENNASRGSGRLALDFDKVYKRFKHEVALELRDKIRVIIGGDEAQSPWGSCGCPAAVGA